MGRLGVALLVMLAFLAALAGFAWFDAKKQRDEALKKLEQLEAQSAKATQPALTPAISPQGADGLLESLKPLLKVENEEVRARAVELAAYAEPKGADALLEQVLRSDKSAKVKVAALDAIGKQKINSCRQQVLEMLKADDAAVRRKAAWTLGALGKVAETVALQDTRASLVAALMAENQAWVDALIKEAERVKMPKKEAAPVQSGQAFGILGPYLAALGEIGDAETAKQLEFFMESKDPLVRRETAMALGKIAAPDSKKILMEKHKFETDPLAKTAIAGVLSGPGYKLKLDPKTGQFKE